MKIYIALAFIVALVLASCKHPLHVDWTQAVDMNDGRELYEAQKVEAYLNTK